jgi:hypothetical protein
MAAPQVNEMRRQAELDDVREFGKAGGAKVVPSRGDGEEEPKLTPEQIEENKKLLDLYKNNRAYLVPRKTFRDEQFVERPGGHLKWPNKEPGVDEKGLALKPIEQWGGAFSSRHPSAAATFAAPLLRGPKSGASTPFSSTVAEHIYPLASNNSFSFAQRAAAFTTLSCAFIRENAGRYSVKS